MVEDGDPHRAWQKATEAVEVLATGSGTLRARLRNAYTHHLSAFDLPALPWPELKRKYEALKADLEPWLPVNLNVEVQSNDDLRNIAQRTTDLCLEILKRVAELDTLRTRSP